MQPGPAERSRQPGRGRRGGSESKGRASIGRDRSPEEDIMRVPDGGNKGGDAERGRERARGGRGRRAASEGGDGGEEVRRLRWKVNQLEKEKLQLTSSHNQEACGLQAEVTRLRSSVEHGEAQRAELNYQLTVSRRDAERVAEDSRTFTERAAQLQQTVEELQKALLITRQAREEDQHALQQDVEERDQLIKSFGSENQRLHRLLQEQEEALGEAERRMAEVQRERQKEAELSRRQAEEVKYLTEREERSRQEKELWDQRGKSLEASIEAERAAHLETKFNAEIVQLRLRDLEAALALERSGQQEAQRGLELLRVQFREVERAYGLERERSDGAQLALERLQTEYEKFKSDQAIAVETEKKAASDLTERLEEEKRLHANTHSLLEQAVKRQSDSEETFRNILKQIRDKLQQHQHTGDRSEQAAKDDGKRSPTEVLQLLRTTLGSCRHRLDEADRRAQDLLSASEKLQDENQALQQLTSDQRTNIDESQQVLVRLHEEVARLHQESSDWSTQRKSLQEEVARLHQESSDWSTQRKRLQEEVARLHQESSDWSTQRRHLQEELQKQREEREEEEKEREQRTEEINKITEHYEKESTARLSFLYRLYQRLLAGCVLLDRSQSILGNFTWTELCDVISEQVEQLTSDLQKANHKIGQLQSACDKKSVCVRELQRSQECVLSRLEASVRRREEAWSSQHTHTVSQLQTCRSQCDTLRDHASSLERRCDSLTSDLSQLQDRLSKAHRDSFSFLSACVLLGGALRHAHRRLSALCEQKSFLIGRLAQKELLEEEVRRLADALGGEEGEEEQRRGRRRRAMRRWRRSVCAVLAMKRWCVLSRKTSVLFRLERGGGAPAVCVCGPSPTATKMAQDAPQTDDEVPEGVCARWLRSKRLSSAARSSMSDLQELLEHKGSAHQNLIHAARSGLSRLLDHLLDQSASSVSSGGGDEDSLSGRLRLGLNRLTPPRPDAKTLVAALQQHFLLFSQRLHTAEVERRSLRMEVANLKRGLRQERKETCRTVAAERFHRVCEELRQALSREQEAQTLVQDQSNQLRLVQRQVDAHAGEQTDTQRALNQNTQALAEARQEVSRKERSLRILGKHLSGVQTERKQLEERLQRAEVELRDASRRQDCVIRFMKAAESSCKQVRESLVQSQRSQSAQPRPLLFPREQLELSGAESIMGAPEVAACQSFLSVVSQLCHTCSSRVDWLEQEVSAHRSHVVALRSELQDACLRDNQAYVPVEEFPETSPSADVEKPPPVISISPAPSETSHTRLPQTNPAPSLPPKPGGVKMKEKKTMKKSMQSGGKRGGSIKNSSR